MSVFSPEAEQLKKLEKLKKALAEFEEKQANGESTLFDHEKEEKKSAVRRRALLLLDQRARSEMELRNRLLALEFEADIIDEVIADLYRAKLLDDEHFAMEWVRQRAKRRGKSSRVLDQELREKGVAESVRAIALEQIDVEDERDTAWLVAVKKARSEKNMPQDRSDFDKALRRVVGALARRGFPSGLSIELARKALDERFQDLQSE